MADQRLFKRIKKNLPLSICAGGEKYTARTEDISAIGFFIKTQKVFPPGTILDITVQGAASTIEASCRVVWARRVPSNLFHLANKNGMGVLIVDFKKGEEEYQQFFKKKD